jgi:NADPH:quinone reductase-like Zn-dependent oxidoreductase
MRAVYLPEQGGIDALVLDENFPDPKPGEGQVVLRVGATSLNYHDVFTCEGMPGIKLPLPMIIGLDIAGEIVEVGKGVDGWKVGDRVLVNPLDPHEPEKGLMGEMLHGGTAEYCVTDATRLIALPDGVSFEQAASLPVAYGTAYRMMFTNGDIQPGDKVLILGASGGVGSACVLLAKMHGCEVVACGSSPEKLEALKSWGADHVIDYKEKDFVKEIWGLYEKPHRRRFAGGVNVTINFTGGDTWVPSFRVTQRGGKVLTCGATAGYDPKTDLRFIWTFELKILGSNSFAHDDLKALVGLIDEGKLKPVIDTVLPLDQTAEGVRQLKDREVIGKIIITP